MLFGLTNAPESFQGYVNKILAEKLNIFVIVYLDNILIYIKDLGKDHIKAIQYVLEVLRKYGLYINLKKCRFHQDGFWLLGFVIFTNGIRMKEQRIDAVKKWPESESVWDIQLFIGFANFYQRFIKDFSKILVPLTAMLKTIESSVISTSRIDDNEIISDRSAVGQSAIGEGAIGRDVVGRSDVSRKSAKSKSWTKSGHLGNSNNSEKPEFLIPKAKKAFNYLRQASTKALIFRPFNLEWHIRIETDASGYTIKEVPSQLTQNQMTLDGTIRSNIDWHSIAYFSKKMIPAETWYETYNSELLAIFEIFKIWQHYLEGCKYKVLVFTNHNNFCQFINTKSLSFGQVY